MFNAQKGHNVEVEFKHADGSIFVTITCNPLKLYGDERELFFKLADLVREYQYRHQDAPGAPIAGPGVG